MYVLLYGECGYGIVSTELKSSERRGCDSNQFVTVASQRSSMEFSWIIQSLRSISSDLSMFVDGRSMCLDVVEGYKWRLEMVLRELTNEMLTFVQRSFTILSSVVDKLQIYQTRLCYQSAVVMTGCVGRPCFNVSGSQLKALIENRFSVTYCSYTWHFCEYSKTDG